MFIFTYFSSFSQSLSPSYLDYIAKYKDIAILHQQEYGIPASITLAQGLLESGAGLSDLATVANNHFGIKCHKDWVGNGFYKDDDEKNECFRSYDNVETSFEDHARFLKKKRYEVLFTYQVTDYKSWAQGLKQCGYATDPNYPDKLIGVIEKYQLFLYDTNQPILGHRKELKGDESMEHAIEEMIVEEVNMIHPIKKKWGLHYVVVHTKDSIDAIADEFGIPKKKLLKFNDYSDDNPSLKSGDIIYLEEKEKSAAIGQNYHIVNSGETLRSISQTYGIRLKSLLNLNQLKENSPISPGMQLKLR